MKRSTAQVWLEVEPAGPFTIWHLVITEAGGELRWNPGGIRRAAKRSMAEQNKIVGRRILLVEDDQGARESIKLLLTIDRHEVAEATGGAEAIELLKWQPFDLAILDYFMPEMPGSEVALHCRDIAPAMPVLMITAYLEKLGDSEKPVDAVLGKPFAIEDLRQAIAKLLS